MKSFLDDRLAIDRLKKEYELHRNLVIGFDFDNTVFDYHHTGLDMEPVITLLRQCSNLGFTLCLYTVLMPDGLTTGEKADYCKDRLIDVKYINCSPLLSTGRGKPFFNILLDDRAGLASAYNILRTALMELELIIR
jgi:hypothetical protein